MFFASWEDDVVEAHVDASKLPTECDETGRVTSPEAVILLDHAQRVAEDGCWTSMPTRGATTS